LCAAIARPFAVPHCLPEAKFDTGLLHYRIGRMPGLYFAIDGKVGIRYRAEPDVVVALAVTMKGASIPREYVPDFLLIFSHQKWTIS
jgi:hypothetical protein